LRHLPKFKAKPKPKTVKKTWRCPGCNIQIKTVFNGEMVRFFRRGKLFSMGGGIYESVEITCPNCGGAIIFTREELEKEVS